MCRDWLCKRGNNGICYFQRDPNRVGGFARDLTEEDWDELDRRHDEVIADPTSQSAASNLGIAIRTHGEEATQVNKSLGEQRFQEMKQRYVEPKARITRKVTLFRTDDSETAASKVRELGDQFASALRDALK